MLAFTKTFSTSYLARSGPLASRCMSTKPPLPESIEFSSGPCKKHPGYNVSSLPVRNFGRSHRSKVGKETLKFAIEESKRLLGVPADYRLGIVPASDTGAYEMAMWSFLGHPEGPKDIDVLHWESFGKGWFGDATSHLELQKNGCNVNEYSAGYGELPDLSKTANGDHDTLFTFNGTTSGVRLPRSDPCGWIKSDRKALTFCDATSAAFAMDMPWDKLDVTTYSWQKVLGGEGGHGILILSPRAVERLETLGQVPGRPLPKIFRMLKKGKLDEALFTGATINTPSMLAVEDYIGALKWADSIGGVPALIARAEANLNVVKTFVSGNDWIDFLAKDEDTISSTSVCLTLDLSSDEIKAFTTLLEKEGAALDIGGYRDAPPSIRIWCGSTVETADVEALMPWLEYAYNAVKN